MRRPCSRMMARNFSRALRVGLRRALQGLDETEQRGQRRAQFVAGVGDEIGAHALDAARLREVAKRQQHRRRRRRARSRAGRRRPGTTARSGTRSLHSAVSASPPAATRRMASVTSGARSARTSGSPILRPGSSVARRGVGEHHPRLGVDENGGLRHGVDQLARRGESRAVAPSGCGARIFASPMFEPRGAQSSSSCAFSIASLSERQRRTASCAPSSASASTKGTI